MTPETEDVLRDLIDRMQTAAVRLVQLASERQPLSDDDKRLISKAHGVTLARSYVEEELRRRRS